MSEIKAPRLVVSAATLAQQPFHKSSHSYLGMTSKPAINPDTVSVLKETHVERDGLLLKKGENLFGVSTAERGSDVEFNEVTQDPYHLSYACLMLPRFSNHLLVGDIFSYLQVWMQQICISFNWRLDFLDVQPRYLQWVLTVPMTYPPARFVRLIRDFTSSQIFSEFPRFHKENISNDFWAAGELILVGSRPHPEPMIEEFINMTRRRQGLNFWGA
jgi:REP element-mobilizing transposase RayT